MMLGFLYRSRCFIAFALIALLAACNVKSDMDAMERLVREIESKYDRGEDISQDTSIFQARRYFNLSDDAEMKTLAALYSGCVYWQQNDYDSAMKALDEAIVTARESEDLRLMEKVQTTIAALHGNLDQTENMISVFLRRRRMLNIILLALVAAVGVVLFLLYRSAQKRAAIAEMKLSIAELQKESESLSETNRDNLFQRAMMIYKVFSIGEKKDIDQDTFNKVKSSVCGKEADTAYEAIFDAYHQVYPEVVQRLRDHQPSLTESEFKVCILSMMPFSVKEVADIIKVSPAMVGKCRTGIRKKLGITEARGSIEELVAGL
jgi:DNA-binding CsgD family transcriptional regulator/cell division protein FtsB